jgi:hypothetical protein
MQSALSAAIRTASRLLSDCSNMATDTQMTGIDNDPDRIRLPGFGKEVTYLPDPVWDRGAEEWERFPHAIADALASSGVTLRERRMLEFVNQITDACSIPSCLQARG